MKVNIELDGISYFAEWKDEDNFTAEEATEYVKRGKQKYHHLHGVKLTAEDGGEVTIEYCTPERNFNRLRRISGYLVPDLSKWNAAKKAEEHDRVKHGLE